jgi:hypothetical protein
LRIALRSTVFVIWFSKKYPIAAKDGNLTRTLRKREAAALAVRTLAT